VNHQSSYDPATYWDAKAKRAAGDATRAVGMDHPRENLCIDRIQRRLISPAIRNIVRPSCFPGDRCLDFGCGTGRWLEFLTGSGFRYSGFDISGEIIAIGKRQFPGADFQQFDGLSVPHPDETFALALSVGVIHHNMYPQQEKILAELVRVLRPGGHLVLFEGIGPTVQPGVVEYPRPMPDWLRLLARLGMTLGHVRKARYWILRSLYQDFLANRLARFGIRSRRLSNAALWCDSILDSILLPLLPDWYVTRALMVFQKPSRGAQEIA